MAANLVFEVLEPRTVVTVHGKENPTDEEWDAYIQGVVDLAGPDRRAMAILVVTEGGGPNSVQRGAVTRLAEERFSFRTAVITDSRVVRGIVTAVSWFNVEIKPFAPGRIADGLSFLGLDTVEQARALASVQRLRGKLGLQPLSGTPAL